MFDLRIADVDLRMPFQDFEKAMQDAIDDYSEDMKYNVKQMSTRHGNHMYKVIIENDQSSEMEVVAEQDDATGDIIFKPLKFDNMNKSFYRLNYASSDVCGEDIDPALFFCFALGRMCQSNKGTFGYIDTCGNTTLIKEGRSANASVALVDSNGTVYSCMGAKSVKTATEDGIDFSVQKPIGEWLGENTEVRVAIANLPMDQKMNYIGKWLIQARIKEDIEADEFMDIFRQAGILGYTDASVLNIYKLIM